MNCEECGKPLLPGQRKDARFCRTSTCRAKARRKRLAAEREAQRFMLTLEGNSMLQQLKTLLPETGKRVEVFIQEHGVGCTEAAIKLCLSAMEEAKKVA